MIRLVRSELLKISTTKTWWLFGIGVLAGTAFMQFFWILTGNHMIDLTLHPPAPDPNLPPEAVAQERADQADLASVLVQVASRVYTAGSFFTGVFVLLLGALVVTNEYYHQTATTTFLTTPHRTKVVFGKLVAAVLAAGAFWLFTTAVDVAGGVVYFQLKGYDNQLGEWSVTRAILMNALVLAIWAIIGLGLGVLIRSQVGAVVTATAAYFFGFPAAVLVTGALHFIVDKPWVDKSIILWPAVAALVMTSADKLEPDQPPWWVAALILTGYAVISGTIGTLIMRRRDIS